MCVRVHTSTGTWGRFLRDAFQLKRASSRCQACQSEPRLRTERAGWDGRDYKPAWCFQWGIPCWATWSQLPLSAVNPLSPAEKSIQKRVTRPGVHFVWNNRLRVYTESNAPPPPTSSLTHIHFVPGPFAISLINSHEVFVNTFYQYQRRWNRFLSSDSLFFSEDITAPIGLWVHASTVCTARFTPSPSWFAVLRALCCRLYHDFVYLHYGQR